MMALSDFHPSLTTMENITASGEFELISNVESRKNIIDTYNTTEQFEGLLTDYVNQYLTPYIIRHVRIRDFSSLNGDFIRDPLFENIVIGYSYLLAQKIKGYQVNIEQVRQLNTLLEANH